MSDFIIVMEPNGKFVRRAIDPEVGVTLDILQKGVNGLIEGIVLGEGLFGYVNEEGKMRGYWLNPVATKFVSHFNPAFPAYDFVAGWLVVVGYDSHGNDMPVPNPDDLIQKLLDAGGTDGGWA